MITYHITYTLKSKTERDRFFAQISAMEMAEKSRQETGCICYEYRIPTDKDKENKLFLREEWESREAQKAHTNQPHFNRLIKIKEKYDMETEVKITETKPQVTAVYFSPTKGTKKYAEAVAGGISEEFQTIDLTKSENRNRAYQFGADDLVVVGAPVYAGRLPLLPEGLFTNLQGDGAKAVVLAVYGNRDFDDALLETVNVLQAQGFVCVCGAALLAEHTYSDKLAGKRPSPEDLAEAADFGRKIKAALEEGRLTSPQKMPGQEPYRKEAKRMPKYTETTELCTECGLCAKLCPVGAISLDADMTADGEKCIGCLACVKSCPRGGRKVNDPSLYEIQEKLEPAFGGVHKANQYFIEE